MTFKWERVPDFCFIFCCLDHLENDCKNLINTELTGEKVIKNYSASLRADGIQLQHYRDGQSSPSGSRKQRLMSTS